MKKIILYALLSSSFLFSCNENKQEKNEKGLTDSISPVSLMESTDSIKTEKKSVETSQSISFNDSINFSSKFPFDFLYENNFLKKDDKEKLLEHSINRFKNNIELYYWKINNEDSEDGPILTFLLLHNKDSVIQFKKIPSVYREDFKKKNSLSSSEILCFEHYISTIGYREYIVVTDNQIFKSEKIDLDLEMINHTINVLNLNFMAFDKVEKDTSIVKLGSNW